MALCWGKWLVPRGPGQRLQGERHRCQINTKCSCRLMLFLMRAQWDCASRRVPLKRLYLPKSPTGRVGAGKWMLPIREAQDCWSCQRCLASPETGTLNLAELRTQRHFLMLLMMPKAMLWSPAGRAHSCWDSGGTQSTACYGQAWAPTASVVPITHALCVSCSISGR